MSMSWDFGKYRSSGGEGKALVAGGVLNYRLAGDATAKHVVVFESGWTAPSFSYAVWLEEALAPHVRVLSYDRAGVGESRRMAPLTPPGVTQQLTALLSSLGIAQPVVVVGHSYGGLIGALHAAQAPALVAALVQIDPTPELDDETVDAAMRSLPAAGRFLQLCALTRIDGPLFLDMAEELPPEVFERVKRNPWWLARSLNGSITEIRLLEDVRRIVRASQTVKQCPRLVISGDREHVTPSWLQRLLINGEKARKYWDAVDGLHRRQASLNDASRWVSLPYNHVSLVTNRAGAHEIASRILSFTRESEFRRAAQEANLP
jgi:pimeloyl-ACP methyl ester carboxylesterase